VVFTRDVSACLALPPLLQATAPGQWSGAWQYDADTDASEEDEV
jgi:hypothetical protein